MVTWLRRVAVVRADEGVTVYVAGPLSGFQANTARPWPVVFVLWRNN